MVDFGLLQPQRCRGGRTVARFYEIATSLSVPANAPRRFRRGDPRDRPVGGLAKLIKGDHKDRPYRTFFTGTECVGFSQ